MQDKMALFKDLKELREQILYWEKYQAVNNMGKWARSVRLEILHRRYAKIENKIQKLKKKKNDD
jgi:hypothetical protein